MNAFGVDRVRFKLFEDFVSDPEGVCIEIFRFLGIEEDVPVDTSTVYNQTGPHRFTSLGRVLTGRFPGRRYIRAVMPEFGRRIKEALIRKNVESKPTMHPNTRSRLLEQFGPDVHRLQELIERDLSEWST